MKYFDIVTQTDQVFGKKTAAECHANPEYLHRVIHFTLQDPHTKKILIAQRSFSVAFDTGLWCFMGEHVLSGEFYDQAVVRSVRDELGISISKWVEHADTIFSYATQRELTRFFIVEWNGEKIQPNYREIEAVKWISVDELKQSRNTYSSMTQYWIDHVQWEQVS